MTLDNELVLEGDGPIARIIFNRPDKANAFRTEWIKTLVGFLRAVDADPDVRAVLIRGEGKNFQAGGDVESISVDADGPLHERQGKFMDELADWNRFVRAIRAVGKPVVVSVQGACAGGGIGIVAAADLVIAADDATFILAQARNGFTVDGSPSYFLPRQIGHKKAMEWALLAPVVKADEAARLGLINFVVPLDDLASETDKLLAKLATGPTLVHGLNKRLINQSLDHDFDRQLAMEMDISSSAVATKDFNEGMNAFIERRRPSFCGQ